MIVVSEYPCNIFIGFQRPVYVFTKGVSGESYDALGVNIAKNQENVNMEMYEDY